MTTHATMPENGAAHNDPVTVSAVIGEGPEAHRIARVGAWTFTVPGAEGQEPLIRDVDAAVRLGFARPRSIRDLIKRIWPENNGPCVRRAVRRTQMPTGGVREIDVDEFWLTEAQLLRVCARSETPVAESILDDMIRVYMAVRRGLIPPPAAPAQVDPAVMLTILRQFADLQATVVELRSALSTGPVMGYGVARSNVLIPLRRVAARLAVADPVRRYRQWLSHLHRELRLRLGRGMSTPYGLMPAAALPEALAFLREREADVALRERPRAAAQTSLALAKN